MKTQNTFRRIGIYLSLTVIATVGILMFGRSVFADNEKITFSESEIRLTIDDKNAVISGSVDDSVTALYWSLDGNLGNNFATSEKAFSVSIDTDYSFSQSIPKATINPNENGVKVYFYADLGSGKNEKKSISVKLIKPVIEGVSDSLFIYSDTEALTITPSIKNTTSAASIIWCTTKYEVDNTIDTDETYISGTLNDNSTDSYTITVSELDKFTSESNVYLYAINKGKKVLAKKEVRIIVEKPEFELRSSTTSEIEIDLENPTDFENGELIAKFNVTNYNSDTRIGYAFNEYAEGTDEETIIYDLVSQNNFTTINKSNMRVYVKLDTITLDAKPIYFYLYKNTADGKKIFDTETITYKRKRMEVDNDGAFVLQDEEGNATDLLYLKAESTSVNAKFLLKNITKYYKTHYEYNDNYNKDNPYKVRILDSSNNSIKSGRYWNRNGNYPYTYDTQINISDLQNLPKEGANYSASLEYSVNGYYIKIGKTLDFSIKHEIPEMIWDDEEIQDSKVMSFPVYSDELTATITGNKENDVIAWTTAVLDKDELKDWARDTNTEVLSINSSNGTKAVTFKVGDFPLTDKDCYFYLIRERDNADPDMTDVYELGKYSVKYRELVNYYGTVMGIIPLSEQTHEINGVTYSFIDTTVTKQAVINGRYENGLKTEEIIYSFNNLTGEDLQNWGEETTGIVTQRNNYPGSNTNFYNPYRITTENITFDDENDSKTLYIYVKREIEGGKHIIMPIGEVVIKESHTPELQSIVSDSSKKDKTIEINVQATDIDTGVSEIIFSYKKNGEPKEDRKYYPGYKPNQSVSEKFILADYGDEELKSASITLKDLEGRETTYGNILVDKPELIITPKNALETFGKENYYYSNTRNVDFEIKANKSSESVNGGTSRINGLKSLNVTVNGIILVDKKYDASSQIATDTITINLANGIIPDSFDSVYEVKVVAYNDMDNRIEDSFKLDVDSKIPEISKFVVNNIEKSTQANTEKYTYITNSATDIQIYAKDEGSGGIKNIKYYWEGPDGSKSAEVVKDIAGNPGNANISVSKNQSYKGFLYANVEDRLGNKADKYVTFGGIIVDLPNDHNAENHIDIGVPNSGNKDKSGNPLYNKAETFSIKVADTSSGIKSVEWRVSAPNDSSADKSGSLSINDGYLSDGSWKKNGSEKNIVTSVSKDIVIDGNSDDMTLYVRMTDNAGNVSEKSVKFSIDKVKPTISVTYGNQTGDPDFGNYYAASRTATIVVKERNFNQDSANAMVSNTVGNKGTLSAWKENRDTKNPDNSTYTATITFEKDDRYILSYQCSDRAGNTSDAVTTPEFVIDTITPEVSVTFDNGNGRNGYYANKRTATISVKEVNFDASRLSITGVNGQAFYLSNWTKKDNTYSTLISFEKDGDFSFDVSVKDKAGNVGNSIHVPKFTIDQNKPEIIIEGVKNKSANNGTVAPKITVKDTNIDKDSVKIELTGIINGGVDITDKYSVSEDGLTFTFKNIENVKENDDLYTLRVSVKDLAGNVSTEEITFSVNRFGSIYILGDNLKNINDKYVKAVKGLDLTEINVNKIKSNSVVITLTINGVPKTLAEGSDYTIEAVENDGDWKQYKYVFEDSLFTKDGSYILTVVSEDEAGNKNNNVNQTKEAEVKFGVDATAPIIAAVNFEANKYYDENGMDFSISVKDNMILNSVKVYVNGTEVSCVEQDEIYTFHVDESNKRQEIKVVATDLAGNEAIESYEGILIAGNIFVRFIHSKLAILITAVSGSTVLLGGGILLLVRKIR